MKAHVQTRFQFTFTEDEYLTLAGLVLAGQEASGPERRNLARIIDAFTCYVDVSEGDDEVSDEPEDPPEEEPDDRSEGAEPIGSAAESVEASKPDRRSFLRRR